jgi:hypothetical protein
MAYPLETLGMSPTQEEAPESSATAEQPPKAREWGQFELDAVCSLVCQHQHRPLVWRVKRSKRCVPRKFQDLNMDGLNLDDTFDPKDWALRLATKLNKTLHGVRDFKHDIPIEDVRDVLDFIEEEYKFVVKFIERQHTPFRVTRTKKYVFERMYNDFNDKLQAWTVKRWKRRGRGIRDCIVVNTKEPPKTRKFTYCSFLFLICPNLFLC